MGERITVVIVDDHQLVRQGVRGFLETQPDLEVVGEAATGEEAVRVAEEMVPDVMLLDLVMPGGIDGVEATRRIKKVSPRTAVVILTSYHEDEHIFPAIKAGTLSYVLKDIGPQELAEVVRKASQGEAVLDPHVASRLMNEIQKGRSDEVNPFRELSIREMEVLRLMAEGLSNAEIAERLIISVKTVKGHVSNILSKLELEDRTQAAVYAWKTGLVRRE